MRQADYYFTLGVDRHADSAAVKQAYRRLAKACHPDRNPGDVAAEAMFKKIAEAYSVLSNDQRRAAYDAFTYAEPHDAGAYESVLPLHNDQVFESVLASFARDTHVVPKAPRGLAIFSGAISARAYHGVLAEGFSRLTRAAAEKFFRDGGPGWLGDSYIDYPAVLTESQIALGMSYWDSRVAGTLRAYIPLTQADVARVRAKLEAARNHLQEIADTCDRIDCLPAWLSSAEPGVDFSGYIERIEARLKLLEQPAVLRELLDLQNWRSAVLKAEALVTGFDRLFAEAE